MIASRASNEPADPRVYETRSFICGNDGCIVTFAARPPDRIAAVLLEEIGDWFTLLRELPDRTVIPPGVTAAVEAAHEAVANWSDLLAEGARRGR